VWHAEYRDARLVEVYDAECSWGRDDDYFASVVGALPVRVLDLGCGTGRLTLGLAQAGHTVTGIDPARASLEAARRKPGAELVTWREGTATDVPTAAFDVAVMTSHVSQLFLDDDEWSSTLAELRRAMVPGGRLAFDGRDPRARGWERWNPVDSRRQVALGDGGIVDVWTEVTAVESSAVVHFTHHYTFPDDVEIESTACLRFRSEAEVRVSLRDAGFRVEQIYGGWERQPIGHADGELLVVARAAAQAPPSASMPSSSRTSRASFFGATSV
jgi:SAM-dependent methyltransferase